jgi:hypothetical protein
MHRCVAGRHRGQPHRLGGGVQKTGARQSDGGRADAGDRTAEGLNGEPMWGANTDGEKSSTFWLDDAD